MKNHTYFFFDEMVNIKNLDPNKIKIDERSHKNIQIYYIGQVIFKDLRYVKIKILNPLYLIASKTNGYFEKISGNKYLTLVPTNESKEIMKNYEEMWSQIRDLIRLITNGADDYDEKYMKINFNQGGDLPS